MMGVGPDGVQDDIGVVALVDASSSLDQPLGPSREPRHGGNSHPDLRAPLHILQSIYNGLSYVKSLHKVGQ